MKCAISNQAGVSVRFVLRRWSPSDVRELNLGALSNRGASTTRTPKHPTMAFTALNNQPPVHRPPPAQVPTPSPAPAKASEPPVEHPAVIDAAFAGSFNLRKRVHAVLDEHPSLNDLFGDISAFILSYQSQLSNSPTTKKRKLDESNDAQNGTTAAPAPAPAPVTTSGGGSLSSTATKAFKSYTGVSFSIPQRKKFTLELLDKKDGGIRAVGATGNVEFALAWKDADQVFCLPVPEKAKKQHNFIVIPVHGDGVNPVPEGASAPEPIVWTFEEATGKNIVEGEDPGPGPMAEAIHHCLIQAGTGKEVVFPSADEFASAIPESHRKGEKAYHVKAHRGSKEGMSWPSHRPIELDTNTPMQATCSSRPSARSTG